METNKPQLPNNIPIATAAQQVITMPQLPSVNAILEAGMVEFLIPISAATRLQPGEPLRLHFTPQQSAQLANKFHQGGAAVRRGRHVAR